MASIGAPKVSVGLPVYNGENYLAAALVSLLAQSFTDFEIILSDNGSTDGTEEICRRFAALDSRVRYLRQDENRGMAWNYNHCFHQARGEYFRWHAHDDLVHSEYLQACVDALDAEPDVVLAHSRTVIIGGELLAVPESQRQNDQANANDRRLEPLSENPHRRYGDVLLHTVWGYEIYGLARTSAMHKTGLHRNYTCSEKVFLAELALLGKYREIPRPLFYSRQHSEQASWAATEQESLELLNAKPQGRFVMPRQFKSVGSHLAVLCRLPLPFRQRFWAFAMLGRYVFQPRIWSRVARNALRSQGPAGSIPAVAQKKSTPAKVFEGTP